MMAAPPDYRCGTGTVMLEMAMVPIDPWDLRHLLLSLGDPPGPGRDAADLDAVVARVVAALRLLPPRPVLGVPRDWTAPALVEGHPLWILEGNGWLLAPAGPGGDCLVVDVPPSPGRMAGRIAALDLRPVAIVLTHGHVDHAGGAGALLDALGGDIDVYVHPADRDLVLHPEAGGALGRVAEDVRPPGVGALVPMVDGTVFLVGGATVRAVHTPGHTPGSTCLVVDGGARPLLFSGDTLFAAGTGRCDLPGGSRPDADASLAALLLPLPDETVVLPGHGAVTTVGAERAGQLARFTPPPLAA